jgi:hypothetical protein
LWKEPTAQLFFETKAAIAAALFMDTPCAFGQQQVAQQHWKQQQ